MNGTELRSFHHFQILTWIAYFGPQQKSWKLNNFEVFLIHCKTVEVSQNGHIWMQTWLTSIFLMEGKELRSFSHFPILTKIGYPDLSRNLQIDKFWSVFTSTVKLWKSVKMIKFKCKDDLQVFSRWIEQN